MFEPYLGGPQVFKVGGFYLQAFELEHDGCDNRGVYIMTPSGEKIVYATDFEFIRHRFTKLGINHFILECNHMDEVDPEENDGKFAHVLRGHSSLTTVCEFLRVNKTENLRTVMLCHLSAENSDPKEMVYRVKDMVGENVDVWIADKGLGVMLSTEQNEGNVG